jgi:glycosyltransferase involved in cell wall biosynthesis
MHIAVAMPVYEDWDSALELCRRIDLVLREDKSVRGSLLLIDDGSTACRRPTAIRLRPEATERISILELRRNLGHQRAIAIGLAYIQQHWKCDAVVVMDADGEDRPEEIPRLLAAMKNASPPVAVFAERRKRPESAGFRFLYQCYRFLHRILSGRDIRFGNYSVLPWSHLESLVVYPELWNHYAATFLKSRLPYVQVRADRGERLADRSRMNFTSLVVHGLSAVFANQEVVGTRLLVMILLSMIGLFFLMGVVVGVRLLTNLAIPGWATYTMGLLLILVAQALIASLTLVFSIMMNRSHLGFLPIRDYSHFVCGETALYPQ